MDLALLKSFLDSLRMKSVGNPKWVVSKGCFEYDVQSIEVATILKLIRAGQGVAAMDLLCRNGFFVDMSAINRCVSDCTNEVHFLLETYPETSTTVDKFLKNFFSQMMDGYLATELEPVQTKKIHNAMVRTITGAEQNETAKRLLSKIHKTYSGYIHAGYAHIMEMYGGPPENQSFNLCGVPSLQQREMHQQVVQSAYNGVLLAIAFASRKFELRELSRIVLGHCS